MKPAPPLEPWITGFRPGGDSAKEGGEPSVQAAQGGLLGRERPASLALFVVGADVFQLGRLVAVADGGARPRVRCAPMFERRVVELPMVLDADGECTCLPACGAQEECERPTHTGLLTFCDGAVTIPARTDTIRREGARIPLPSRAALRATVMGKLTAGMIAERALEIGDAEGLDAVTIRRLAGDLGVTPMALYWHYKNKEQLLIGMADHLIGGFAPEPADERPWQEQLRDLTQGLVRTLRAHPCAKDVIEQIDAVEVPNFLAVWDLALGLARGAGFSAEESCLITKYLLQSAIAIADAPVHHQAGRSDEEVARLVRAKRLGLETLPAERYPHLVEMAGPLVGAISPEVYDTFGVDLVLAGIEALAAER
ncbi:hypothetical protein C1J01_30770 [Nonomuraea aridisoli]|uniref:HTH tetR-type domain-containing protein n=2 Tax=Nonomuraea aridisoli TaxID=2070368 RepID=A0A2W2EUS1_9ACTN|nr:hypothetical protein C1J01_30770 [Nonomuraea aridisoli]